MRFRKTVKIAPGVKLNISKSGVSTTIGGKGASVNIGEKGTYLNTGIPGTGIYDRQKMGEGAPNNSEYSSPNNSSEDGSFATKMSIGIVVVLILLVIIFCGIVNP